MVLRGVFLMTRPELDWFYGGGAGGFSWTLRPRLFEDPMVEARWRLVDEVARIATEIACGKGRKKLSVRLKVGDCEAKATANVRLFFPAFATNNPGGGEPNWFYYWKQTSAAVGRRM